MTHIILPESEWIPAIFIIGIAIGYLLGLGSRGGQD